MKMHCPGCGLLAGELDPSKRPTVACRECDIVWSVRRLAPADLPREAAVVVSSSGIRMSNVEVPKST